MKVMSDLIIKVLPNQTNHFFEEMEKRCSDGWSRDIGSEENLKKMSGKDEFFYCYSCTEREFRADAHLWLFRNTNTQWYVSNIVPDTLNELTYDQYNFILQDFFEKVVLPTAKELGIETFLTSSVKQILDFASENTVKLLERFSVAANKTTGHSHPLDEKRWYDFVVSAHTERSTIDEYVLYDWLKANGWAEDLASKLSEDYTLARKAIQAFEERGN